MVMTGCLGFVVLICYAVVIVVQLLGSCCEMVVLDIMENSYGIPLRGYHLATSCLKSCMTATPA